MFSGICSLVRMLSVSVLIPSITLGQVAQTNPQVKPLDRHAERIRKTLGTYPAGSNVFLKMRDGSQRLGTLGGLSATSFELILRAANKVNINYASVDRVQKTIVKDANTVVVPHHNGLVFGLVLAGCLVGFLVFAVIELRKS